MASVWQLLFWCSLCMCSLSVDIHLIKVQPDRAVAGVFEASLGNSYALNASAAADVCQRLNVTIASKAQVQAALQHGLETCRFGWVEEQVAVVPRLRGRSHCGSGNVGLVVWRAHVTKLFDVFCFSSTDFEIHNQASMSSDLSSTHKPNTSPPEHPSSSPRSSSAPHTLSPRPALNYTEDREKHLAVSGRPVSGAVPVAIIITVSFAILLAAFLAPYYSKIKNRTCRRFCEEKQQENIETEVCEHCDDKDLQKSQERNMQEKDNSSCSSDHH